MRRIDVIWRVTALLPVAALAAWTPGTHAHGGDAAQGETKMSESRKTTVAVVDADAGALAAKAAALTDVPGVDVRIEAASLGQLLTDPAFPPDVVLLQQREGERVSVNYKIRVCRLADARVIVITGDGHELAPDVGQLMTTVHSFAQAIPLIAS
jgi:hypothetical protein